MDQKSSLDIQSICNMKYYLNPIRWYIKTVNVSCSFLCIYASNYANLCECNTNIYQTHCIGSLRGQEVYRICGVCVPDIKCVIMQNHSFLRCSILEYSIQILPCLAFFLAETLLKSLDIWQGESSPPPTEEWKMVTVYFWEAIGYLNRVSVEWLQLLFP